MSEITNTLKNPWVLGGGAALGLVLLMMGKTGQNAGTNSDYATSGGLPASIVGAYNIAALGEVTKQAAIAADVGKTAIMADVTKQVSFLDTLSNFNNNAAIVHKQALVSSQGIISKQLETQSAIIIDAQNNSNRLSLAQEQTTQTAIRTNGAVKAAQIQAKAAKSAAKFGAITKLVGAVGAIAVAPFTGGASLVGLAGIAGGASGGSNFSDIANFTGPDGGHIY